MTTDVKQLIDETIALTGAAPPALLDADAPILATDAQTSIYLIGLVGGKDVGKSSLVNAIVGRPVAAPTSYGPGTERVVAYAHESARESLRALLEREVPDCFTIIAHSIDRLAKQVLLDLPDIDSKYSDHVRITRRMLRHMLYPLWIQSVEKYADRQPQELLAAVAEGNDPANFIFCLNKADQLLAREGQAAADELRQDFAARIARALSLPTPPRVLLISATQPDSFDLPALREALSRERPAETVQQSRELAQRRQDRSLLGWLVRQRLPERAERLVRLEREAEELATSRIALPLFDGAIPRLLDDPGQRLAMLAPAMRLRLSRWPIVNAIDSLFSPVLALLQKNLTASASGSANPDAYLGGGTVSSLVQTTFAQLQQLHPQAGELYTDRKLWESMHADAAAADLHRRFSAVVERQRAAIMQRAAGRFSFLFAPLRWLATIGAVLWFLVVQPLLSIMLQQNTWQITRQTLRVLVDALSVTHLLECATFLVMWFLILWVLLRWGTQRRLGRLISRWKTEQAEQDLSLTGQTMQWIEQMLAPIRRRRERVEMLVQRSDEMRQSLTSAASDSDRVPGPAGRSGMLQTAGRS